MLHGALIFSQAVLDPEDEGSIILENFKNDPTTVSHARRLDSSAPPPSEPEMSQFHPFYLLSSYACVSISSCSLVICLFLTYLFYLTQILNMASCFCWLQGCISMPSIGKQAEPAKEPENCPLQL